MPFLPGSRAGTYQDGTPIAGVFIAQGNRIRWIPSVDLARPSIVELTDLQAWHRPFNQTKILVAEAQTTHSG